MKSRRLGWAGLELEADGQTLVIDPLLDPGVFAQFLGPSPDRLIPPRSGAACAVLLTHLHRDHADIAAVRKALGSDGMVARPKRKPSESELDQLTTGEAEAALAESGLRTRECEPGASFQTGPFSVTSLFASDGLGSPQVSWLVEADGQRLLHAGDTLWHGAWWDFATLHGPIDVACLPANGVAVDYPLFQPAVSIPAVMGPEQAVEAARAMRAGVIVPIHYNQTFEHPDLYRPVPDAGTRLRRLAAQAELEAWFLEPGEWAEVRSSSRG